MEQEGGNEGQGNQSGMVSLFFVDVQACSPLTRCESRRQSVFAGASRMEISAS